MKPLLLVSLLALPFLTGCEKILQTKSGTTSGTPLAMNVLVTGQSNGKFLVAGGYAGFRSLYPNAQFINCAASATSLMEWQKGNALYSACMEKVGHAHIDMIIFIQGENEAQGFSCGCSYGAPCNCQIPADHWSQNFTALARNFQQDFTPNVFYSRLGDLGESGPYWSLVRQEQTGTSIGTMVSLDGIKARPSDIHYTADGYYAIGKRFALSYNENHR